MAIDARPIDHDQLAGFVGDARLALIGEASHGTHEFYFERAELTKRLIESRGFNAVAVEADWPDAYRVNRYVRWMSDDRDAASALSSFGRFPRWMWRNTVVRDFVEWLREFNRDRPARKRVGFYGVDLYSLYGSIQAVLEYLDRVDPEAAKRARYRYSCFDHHGEDSQAYGYAASFGVSESCETGAVNALVELRRRAAEYRNMDGHVAREEYFYAEQNARLVRNAEEYYRTMFRGRVSSWNIRDSHMAETIDALLRFLDGETGSARIAVWEHNSHLGDARATEMGEQGEHNVGQLVRQAHAERAVLIGFSAHSGTVTAASNWDEPGERKAVRPGIAGSYEDQFHQAGVERGVVYLRDDAKSAAALRGPRLQRAIGVIYRPETERVSHYFHARLPEQFDAMIHIDSTTALEALE
jgi:erythromycin esterase-like protein